MKTNTLLAGAAALALCAGTAYGAVICYQDNVGSQINFLPESGGVATFSFTHGTPGLGTGGWMWSGGDLGQYLGSFVGTFSYTAPVEGPGGVWTSTVNPGGSGSVRILAPNGLLLYGRVLSATLDWGQITTTTPTAGQAGGTLNMQIQPSGVWTGNTGPYDPTLNLIQQNGAWVSLNFNYGGTLGEGMSLQGLYTLGGTAYSYSGQITPVPEPSTVIAGFGAIGLALMLGRSRLQCVR